MIRPLTALEILVVENGQIQDLTPLSGLAQLRELEITNQRVTDLTPLAALSKLEKLWISGNQVTSLAPLEGLTRLQRLWADYNPIQDAEVVSGLTGLRELSMQHTSLSDVSGWESLVHLEYLDLRQNVLDIDGNPALQSWRKALLDQGAVFEYDVYDPLPEIAVFINSKRVYAHGAYGELAEGSYIKDSRTFVPLRFISEQLGAQVQWDEKARTITIQGDQMTIVLTVGSTEAVQNGKVVALDTAPEIRQGTTFVPLRFLSEQLGLGVQYHQYYPSVAIYTAP